MSDGSAQTKAGTATATVSGGEAVTITSTVADGKVVVSQYTVTLTAGQTLTIATANRLALVDVSAEVTPVI